MNDLKIVSCGTKLAHRKGFTFSESAYPDCYLFLLFETDFITQTKDGIKEGSAYSYILHPPYAKIYHTNVKEAKMGFTNDWMYLSGSMVTNLVKKYSILTDVIVPIFDNESITDIIRQIRCEIINAPIYEQELSRLLTEQLFIRLARNSAIKYTETDKDAFFILSKLRQEMFNDCKKKWSLNELAALSGFSASYFLTLYKSFFHITPIDDLIDHRIVIAMQMLESNMASVAEIATECGFSAPYYFSRIFKQKTGISPSSYKSDFLLRKNHSMPFNYKK